MGGPGGKGLMSTARGTSLEATREFWDANPCGISAPYHEQRAHRYAVEPWIPALLQRIAARHASVLEVGCGQGVDSIELCTALRPGSRYMGIDYSPRSIAVATANAKRLDPRLIVKPRYLVGNAEALDFDAAAFEAVYSLGVLHHTADERAAVREIHRVLAPGGKAYICLYRKPAPKVALAKMLRGVQRGLDLLAGSDRCIYALLKRTGSLNRPFGTMFHECFGVPYMKWYNRAEVTTLFADFDALDAIAIGANLGRLAGSAVRPSPLGYFWVVEATKRATLDADHPGSGQR